MDISEIRLANLRTLLEKAGSHGAFAEKVDTSAAYISQILSSSHPANVGKNLARKIESKLGLEHGWMDRDHKSHSHYRPLTAHPPVKEEAQTYTAEMPPEVAAIYRAALEAWQSNSLTKRTAESVVNLLQAVTPQQEPAQPGDNSQASAFLASQVKNVDSGGQ